VQLSKRLTVLIGFGALVLAGRANAQNVHFAGTTSGCFYTVGGCVPSSTPVSIGGLTYNTAGALQFDDYADDNGYLAIGGDEYNNFGFFTLNSSAFDYNGWNFVLSVMFTAPPGVATLNQATLEGVVTKSGNGVSIQFNTEPTNLTATDGTNFDLTVNQLGVTASTHPATAYVNGAVSVTPEPATVGLMMTGLMGLVPMVRRRRQPRAE